MTASVTEIAKRPELVHPNMADYQESRRDFTWAQARNALAGLPGDRGLNIAYEAIDRHVAAGTADRTALRLIAKNGDRRNVTYGELARRTNRFANVLANQGVVRGDVVAALCGRELDLYVAVLGALKHRCIVAPMLRTAGIADDAWLANLESDIAAEIDAAVSFAEAGTDEPTDQLTRHVYAD